MQHYELMYIVDPSIEDGVDEVKQKVEGIITGREGVVASYEKLGKKRLAYSIAKRQYGVYYLVNFRGNGKIVQALEYFLRLNQLVLRFIILVFSEKNLGLRERTSVVQLEEAERMRAGGRPFGVKADSEDDAISEEDALVSNQDEVETKDKAEADAPEVAEALTVEVETAATEVIKTATIEVEPVAAETSEDVKVSESTAGQPEGTVSDGDVNSDENTKITE